MSSPHTCPLGKGNLGMGCGAGGGGRYEGSESGSGQMVTGMGAAHRTSTEVGSWEPLRSHRLIQSQNDLGWKGTFKIIKSTTLL